MDDDTMWCLSTKFLVRCLSSAGAHEVYDILIGYLMSQFCTTNSSIPLIRDGLDLTQTYVSRVIKSFRLVDSFLRQLLKHGQRYHKSTLSDLIKPTLELLDRQGSGSQFNPLHLMALVDWRAEWFANLMHGHFSRTCLLESLRQHSGIVMTTVCALLRYVAVACSGNQRNLVTNNTSQRLFYSKQEVDFLVCLHSVHIVGRLLLFEQGRK